MSQLQMVVQKLCSRLEQTMPRQGTDPSRARTILVTSAHPKEGKTFVACATAVQLSKLGEGRVLLVDANFDNPQIHRRYRLANDSGFQGALISERFDPTAAFRSEATALDVLPAGANCDPGILFNQQRLKTFLQQASAAYGWIVFDGGSIGRSGGGGLAPLVDGLLLVVDSEHTRRQVVKDALKNVEIDRDRILGVVLNKRKYEIPSFLYRWI